MIKLVTFKTNHTILAHFEENGEEVSLKQPVQVIVQPSQQGPMMGFSPFLEFCQEFKTGIKFNKNDILVITTPAVELENEYNRLFGSGIEIASSIPKL